MAEIYNEQRVLGFAPVGPSRKMYNDQRVLGVHILGGSAVPFYLPANPRVALIGSSSTAQAYGTSPTRQIAQAIGGMHQLRARRRIFRHSNWYSATDARAGGWATTTGAPGPRLRRLTTF